jgi:hypothetical protein
VHNAWIFAFCQAEAFENKSPTLAPTSGELTSTDELMASFNNEAEVASATKMVLPITGGSCFEPANKKHKKEAQRRVQHVGVQGPFIKSKWSHIPITFSQEDLQLKDYLTMMLWLYLVSSRDFWSTMFWLIQAAQRISYLLRPSDRCKSQRTRFMMLHILFVALKEGGS